VALLLLFVFSDGFAAFERFPADPVAAGMGRAGLAVFRTGGFLTNPALPVQRAFAVWWDRPYGLAELTSKQAVLSLPRNELSLGAAFSQSGDEAYSESRATASAGYTLSPDIRAGLAIAWYGLNIDGLPTGSSGVANLGVIGQVSSDFRVAAVWNNVLGSGLSHYDDELPQSLAAAVLFEADDRTLATLDLEQQSGWPTEVRIGVATRVMKPLTIRAGSRFNPSEYTGGFTLKYKVVQVHYALLWHRDLGATHTAGLGILIP
jgi:hypothetical protein